MAISRPFLLAVLGALLLGVTVLAVQNARTTSDNDATPAVIQTQAAPAPADSSATSTPADTLRAAFDLSDVHRARFQANLYLADKTTARISLAGAFDTTGDSAMPRFRVRAEFRAAGAKAAGGFVSLGDRAYFVKGDTGWRMPALLWGPMVQNVSKIGFHPQTWARDVKSKGTERIAGVETEHLVARVDAKAVLNDLASSAGGSVNERAIRRNVKRAELDVWVAKDDHRMRQFELQLLGSRKRGLRLEARLLDVNEPQRIVAPAHVRSGAPAGAFGGLAQLFANGVAGATGADTSSLKALTSPNPGRAARAIRKHQKVVILFGNARGLDDRAMIPVIRSVDRRTKALVLTDDIAAVDRYGTLPEDLAVSQTPSVVIVDRRGHARLIEGYVDSNTLTQAVADAR